MNFNTTYIRKVHWNIVDKCNMSCRFCYLWRNKTESKLSTKIAKELIAQISQNNIRWITFGGGDPLLRQDIYSLIQYAKKCGLNTELQTNGILVNEDKLSYYKTSIDRFGLSIDGEDSETHDTIRNYPGHFENIIYCLELLNKYNIQTTVRTMVCKTNLGKLKRIGKLLSNYDNIFKWSIRQFASLGRGSVHEEKFNLSTHDFIKEYELIVQYNGNNSNYPITYVTADSMKGCYYLISKGGYFYNHPMDFIYKSVGKFPEYSVSSLIKKLDSIHFAKAIINQKPIINFNQQFEKTFINKY